MVTGDVSMYLTFLIQEFREKLFYPGGFLQIGAIGIAYLIAWFFSVKIQQYIEKDIEKVQAHVRFILSPAHFAITFKFIFWLLLVWFCMVLFKEFTMPDALLHMGLNLIAVLLVIRFASFYIKSIFWARLVYLVCLVIISLRIFNLWGPTVHLLESMTFQLGQLSISIWGIIEAIITFFVLWAVGSAVNRFIAHRLATSDQLTYSDRTLIQRVIKAATVVAVVLISLKAAGIHLAGIIVTGGAIGFAVGIGLQKIGSNLVSGIMLLLAKPIRMGDVIALEKGFFGSRYGWITRIGFIYVEVATRNGSLELIPNEVFVTQKIENLSFKDNLVRLNIPFGISYRSDLKKAIVLAKSAAMSINRIVKVPEPKCLVREFGESNVRLLLRAWINDPQNGVNNVKDAVLLTLWDNFQDNDIEFAFPQRDLHIKSAVPLELSKDSCQPKAQDSIVDVGDKGETTA
jgi:small-conductance mechanosensitive channel